MLGILVNSGDLMVGKRNSRHRKRKDLKKGNIRYGHGMFSKALEDLEKDLKVTAKEKNALRSRLKDLSRSLIEIKSGEVRLKNQLNKLSQRELRLKLNRNKLKTKLTNVSQRIKKVGKLKTQLGRV